MRPHLLLQSESGLEMIKKNKQAVFRKTTIMLFLLAMPNFAFATYMTLHCEFPIFSDAKAAQQTQNNLFTSTFLVTATPDEEVSFKAVLIGTLGSVDVGVVMGDSSVMNLIEVTESGIVNLTTVHLNFEEARAKAVLSRHAVIPAMDMWMPTQWYGECDIR
jgi:hypothetical protein